MCVSVYMCEGIRMSIRVCECVCVCVCVSIRVCACVCVGGWVYVCV